MVYRRAFKLRNPLYSYELSRRIGLVALIWSELKSVFRFPQRLRRIDLVLFPDIPISVLFLVRRFADVILMVSFVQEMVTIANFHEDYVPASPQRLRPQIRRTCLSSAFQPLIFKLPLYQRKSKRSLSADADCCRKQQIKKS